MNVIGRSGIKNRVSIAAQVPCPYRYAGNGNVCDVDDCISIVPSGKNFLDSSYQFLMLAPVSSFAQDSKRPSLKRRLPIIAERATGSLKSLGIMPDLARIIYRCSNIKPPQHSPITTKSGFRLQSFLQSLMKNGLG